jgi:hypothetical protein
MKRKKLLKAERAKQKAESNRYVLSALMYSIVINLKHYWFIAKLMGKV